MFKTMPEPGSSFSGCVQHSGVRVGADLSPRRVVASDGRSSRDSSRDRPKSLEQRNQRDDHCPRYRPACCVGRPTHQRQPDVLRELFALFIHTLMGAEADALCGAGYGQRSSERTNSRNGYRHRRFDTRTGTLDLAIPKLRTGSYFPDWLLERGKRAERALTTVVATCYLLGVSTRRMDRLVETLGITGLSKSQVSVMARNSTPRSRRSGPGRWMPARTPSSPLTRWCSRSERRARGQRARLIATGINADGYREIPRCGREHRRGRRGWLTFWRSLTARGLSGVKLVTSDAHAAWSPRSGQRCPGRPGSAAERTTRPT